MIVHNSPNINSEGVFITDGGKDTWLQTFSGRRVSVMHPTPAQIFLEDIGYAIAKQCRFNGQCDQFYSVAEHSVRGSILAEKLYNKDVAREFLMHDATEAYLGDLIRPVKRMIPQFEAIEQGFWKVISGKFDLPYIHSEEVHYLDNVMVTWEKRDILPFSEEWPNLPDINYLNLPPLYTWHWEKAFSKFQTRFLELFPGQNLDEKYSVRSKETSTRTTSSLVENSSQRTADISERNLSVRLYE